MRCRETLPVAGTGCPPNEFIHILSNLKNEVMEKLEFRTLHADEIECRVGTVTNAGCSLLMYKDARVDMRLLDEVVGAMNWKREHELINNNLFCTVSIKDQSSGEWVSKQDVGVESQTEKEKGQASDAFKRACFNWGIGRELYTCPFVWVNLGTDEWKNTTTGKKVPAIKFYVKTIEYKDGKVSHLVIVDDRGKTRYAFGAGEVAPSQANGYDDKLGAAVLDIEAASDLDELKEVYFKYEKQFKDDKRFMSAVSKRKEVLMQAAA